MQRRRAMLFALSILGAPLITAQAQSRQKLFRVGLLSMSNPRSAVFFAAFEQGMRERGYVEGENFSLDFRSAQGDINRLPDLAAELARLPIDVLVVAGTEIALSSARQATDKIPIVVMAVDYDPVVKGYIKSLARPGGNITGIYFMQPMLSGKRLSLLKEAIPALSRVFALWDSHSDGVVQLQATKVAAKSLGLEVQSLELKNPPYDFESAIEAAASEHAQALLLLSSPHFYRQRSQLVQLAMRHRLPTLFNFGAYVEAGGLMAYGASISDMFRHGASYVDKILKGTQPAELPMEQPTKFKLSINLNTAKMLGLTIPPSILFQADEVIK